MKNEKKIWLTEQYAHKTWTVALTLSQEAARAGQYGKGYAVVAHEARILADKLFEYTAKARFDSDDEDIFKGIVDFAIMMKFLSLNAALEIIRMAEINMDFNIPKSMSIFAEELRRIAVALTELADKNIWQKPYTMPEFASPADSKSTAKGEFFLYSISGYPLIEKARNIKEVCYPRKVDTEGTTFSLRGHNMPLINCYRCFDLQYTGFDTERQTVMIVYPDRDNNAEETYAVPIDDLDINAIFFAKAGEAVQPKKEHVLADYAWECWNAVGGEQLVFTDWKKLIIE